MQNHHGVFIVLEGSDGSGKGTQFRLLSERLKAVGHDVAVFDFPRYGEPSSYFVKRYLNGDYGPAAEVSPYTASIFYALDRYEAAPQIKEALNSGKIVLANRYVGSSMAHQGTKFGSQAEQRGFFMWVDGLEYKLLGIPRPNLNLFLRVPSEISYRLIAQKPQRGYTNKKRDEHEADTEHIEKAVAAYDLLCKLFPRDFREINCARNGQIRGVLEINDLIWNTIKPLLPPPKKPGKGAVLKLDENLIKSIKTKKGQPIKAAAAPKKAKGKPQDVYKALKRSKAGLTSEYAKTLSDIRKLHNQMLAAPPLDKSVDRGDLEEALQTTMPLSERPALAARINFLTEDKAKPKGSETDEPQAMEEIIKELAPERQPSVSSNDEAKLIKRIPRNEFELLGEGIDNLTYQEKESMLKDEFAKNGNDLLGHAVYRFDIIANLLTLDFLLEMGGVRELELEKLGPRYGYSVPEIIETAGLDEQYNKCFELANGLYSKLAAQGEAKRADSSLLLGHRGRWKVSLGAADLHLARKNNKYRGFIDGLIEKVAESHPLVAKTISEATQSSEPPQKPRSKKKRKNRK